MKTVKMLFIIFCISAFLSSCWDTGSEEGGEDDPAPDSGNILSNISVTPDSSKNFMFGENITVEFDYSTDESAGVLIIAEPWTNNEACKNFISGDSDVYPSGEGSGTATCTVTRIHTPVNQVHLKMMSLDMATTLTEESIDVNYIYGKGHSYVTNIELDPVSQDLLEPGQEISVSFDYVIYEPDGKYIAVIPLSGREITDNSVYPEPVKYEFGYGKGNAEITVTNGDITIDQLLFDIRTYPNIEGVQKIINVHFEYGQGSPFISSNVDLSPDSPSVLGLNSWVDADFTYFNCPNGADEYVNIYAEPLASGKAIYNVDIDPYPFPEYRGNGTGTTSFSVMEDALVTALRFYIESNDDMPVILYERIIPVYYLYGNPANYVNNIHLSPVSGNFLTFGQEVTLSFDYSSQTGPVNIKIILYTKGGPTPNQEIIAQELESQPGHGSINASFTVHQSVLFRKMKVDQILIQIQSLSGSYLRCFYDVDYTFDDKI